MRGKSAANPRDDIVRVVEAATRTYAEDPPFTAILKSMSAKNLQGLVALNSNVEQTRFRVLSRAMFGEPHRHLASAISHYEDCELLLQKLATRFFLKEYLSDAGTIEWERFRGAVFSQLTECVALMGAASAASSPRASGSSAI